MKKNKKGGFTLIETLVTIGIIVMLAVGISTGTDAAMRAYSKSVFQSECATLSDILNSTLGDILRYGEIDREGEDFLLTNYDYNVKNASFGIKDIEDDITGTGSGGYIVMNYQKDGEEEAEPVYVVNEGAYAGYLKVTDLKINAVKANNRLQDKYLFEVSYTIRSVKDSELKKDYSFRVRQANADIKVYYGREEIIKDPDAQVDYDIDTVTVNYISNVPDGINAYVIRTFWGKSRTFIQTIDPNVSTSFRAIGSNDIACDWYTITGWNTQANGSGSSYTPGEDCDIDMDNDVKNGVLTLYAQWEKTEFTIRYCCNETDGGSGEFYDGTFKLGDTITIFDNPDGEIESPEGAEVTFYDNMGDSESVHAYSDLLKWKVTDAEKKITECEFGTTFNAQLGGFIDTFDPANKDGENGEAVLKLYPVWSEAYVTTPSAPSKSKWNFNGWSKSERYATSGVKEKTRQIINADTEYYAQYKTELTFTSPEKSETKTFYYGYNETHTGYLPAEPERTGYRFDNWYNADGSIISTGTIQNDNIMSYEARWTANPYTVVFNGNGATSGSMDDQNFIFDQEQPLNENKFERIYNITFNPGEGKVIDKKGEQRSSLSLEEIWSFNKWKYKEGAENQYTDKQKVINLTTKEETITLKALWTEGKVVMPDAARSNWRFDGWSDGTNTYKKDANVGFGKNITLNSVWKCTVTYDANGGEGGGNVTYTDGVGFGSTMSDPTRKGYTFKGWSSVKDGDLVTVEDYVKSHGSCTVYAKWQVNSYTITISTENASLINPNFNSGDSIAYNTSLSFTVEYDKDKNKTVSFSPENPPNLSVNGNTYTFNMPANDLTISASSTSSSCLTGDTLITMADGSMKQVKDVKQGDKVLAWDFEKGKNVASAIVFNEKEEMSEFNVCECTFSDGTEVGVVSEHGFFDLDLKKFVYLGGADSQNYVGDRFVKMTKDGKRKSVQLTKVEFVTKRTELYSPVTFGTLNLYANGMMSMPGGITGLFNIYEVDTKTMMYDKKQKQKDIAKYGLYTFEDYQGMIPYEAFLAYNGADLKVAMGKGLLTWEDVEKMAERYIPLM